MKESLNRLLIIYKQDFADHVRRRFLHPPRARASRLSIAADRKEWYAAPSEISENDTLCCLKNASW